MTSLCPPLMYCGFAHSAATLTGSLPRPMGHRYESKVGSFPTTLEKGVAWKLKKHGVLLLPDFLKKELKCVILNQFFTLKVLSLPDFP
ncbi:hypothetical protein C2S52_015174 [Perilla frutescens var. hirtella]|nr:hypothetical protein C2S52_015174 [Perilla frutescens var. hirtella]